MLTAKIMRRCLDILIKNRDEESLECLCKLMTTVGKELEDKHGVKLNDLFDTMEEIVSRKDGSISSRVRFMLQDVIDLRKNRWIARRQENAPKTIDQITKDHENEQMNQMSNIQNTPRKDERGGSGGHNDRKQRRNVSDDGWTTTTRSSRTQFTVQSDKLKAAKQVRFFLF